MLGLQKFPKRFLYVMKRCDRLSNKSLGQLSLLAVVDREHQFHFTDYQYSLTMGSSTDI